MNSPLQTQEITKHLSNILEKTWAELTNGPKLSTEEIDGQKVTVIEHDNYRAEVKLEEDNGKYYFYSNVFFSLPSAPKVSQLWSSRYAVPAHVTPKEYLLTVFEAVTRNIAKHKLGRIFYLVNKATKEVYSNFIAQTTQLHLDIELFADGVFDVNFNPILVEVEDNRVTVKTTLPNGKYHEAWTFHEPDEFVGYQGLLEFIVSEYDLDFEGVFSKQQGLEKASVIGWLALPGSAGTEHNLTFEVNRGSFTVDYQVEKDNLAQAIFFEEKFDEQSTLSKIKAFKKILDKFASTSFATFRRNRERFESIGERLKLIAGEGVVVGYNPIPNLLDGEPGWLIKADELNNVDILVTMTHDGEPVFQYVPNNFDSTEQWMVTPCYYKDIQEFYQYFLNFFDLKEIKDWMASKRLTVHTDLWFTPIWDTESIRCRIRFVDCGTLASIRFFKNNAFTEIKHDIFIDIKHTLSENLEMKFGQLDTARLTSLLTDAMNILGEDANDE